MSQVVRYCEQLFRTHTTKVTRNQTSAPRLMLNFGISLSSSAFFLGVREKDDLDRYSRPGIPSRCSYSANMAPVVPGRMP